MESDLQVYVDKNVDANDPNVVVDAITHLARQVIILTGKIDSLESEIASLKEELEESRRYARSLVYGGDCD